MKNSHHQKWSTKLFNEENTVEDLVRDILSQKLGWKFVSNTELARSEKDVFVESILSEKIKELNQSVKQVPDRIEEILYKLQSIILSVHETGLVKSNEEFSKWLKGEQSLPYGENGQHIPIKLIDFDNIKNNDYIITTQYSFKSKETKRPDIVLLVNGIPLVIIEAKTPVRPGVSWADGALQIAEEYEPVIPELFVPNVFSAATEGKELQYGVVGAAVEEFWSPWRKRDQQKHGIMMITDTIKSLLDKKTVLEMLQHYTLFATDQKGKKIKIIARYPQYEAVNLIVQRVLEGKIKRGLIWHFQGSGKSLLMVFAALRLRFHPELSSPTVLVVVDRIDLDAQIGGTFTASNVPNTISTDSRSELKQLLQNDTRKVILTTIHKFGDTDEILNEKHNIIVFVDEAHRTQEGELGIRMRMALPNAFLFGLTGTPINKRDRNTFLAFGAEQDQYGYLHKYSFEESVEDRATLPINFETRPVKLKINREEIDKIFAQITDGTTEADQAILSQKAGQLPRLIKDKDRINEIAEDIVKHFKEIVEPEGLKGQVVVYDRESCVLYKEAFDRLMQPEDTAVVMTLQNNDPQSWKERFYLSNDDLDALLRRYKDPDDPLKLLIVTSRLLAGFDAPINQAMYLDKPMKDHGLLQAICRTNRPYKNKSSGLVVDYIGVFDDVVRSLNFDQKGIDKVVSNIKQLEENLPNVIKQCLKYFPNIDRSKSGYEGLAEAQLCIEDSKTRDEFAADYSVLSRYWETLSPRIVTKQYIADYKWLTSVYESIQPPTGHGRLIWKRLGPKTIQIIQDNIKVLEIEDNLETLIVDQNILKSAEKGMSMQKPKQIELKIVRRIKKHRNNPIFVKLGERLEMARERYINRIINSVQYLKELLEIAKEVVAEEQKEFGKEKPIEDDRQALTRIFEQQNLPTPPEMIKRIVTEIDEIVKKVRFEGWQHTIAGEREIKQEITRILLRHKLHKDKELFTKIYDYIKQHY
jgi:type I restriction enzyme, R subunit